MDTAKDEFEATCNLFIDSVENYFKHLTNIDSELSTPYLKDSDELQFKEITGMIGVSGNKKGFIYFSADKAMYSDLINAFIGLDDPTIEDILDMAGEISNVVAGNVRTNLGANFMISVPVVFEGRPDELEIPEDVSIFILPVKWNNHEAFVIVGLD